MQVSNVSGSVITSHASPSRNTTSFQEVLKATLFFLAFFNIPQLAASQPIAVGRDNLPSACPQPLPETPNWLAQFVHGGFRYSNNGKIGYKIPNKHLLTHDSWMKYQKEMGRFIIENPAVKAEVYGPCKNKNDYTRADSTGYKFLMSGNDEVENLIITLPCKPIKVENNRQAIAMARELIQKISTMTAQQIVDRLKEINIRQLTGVFSNEMLEFDLKKLPKYSEGIVLRGDIESKDITVDRLAQEVQKKGGKQAAATFKNIFKRLRLTTEDPILQIEMNLGKLSADEIAAVKFLGHVPPFLSEVPGEMLKFASELQQKIILMQQCEGESPVSIAAFAITEYTRIHPGIDANGRTGRALMNAILMEGGEQPVVIPSDAEFVQAIEDNAERPGAFADYLFYTAMPWVKSYQQRLNSKKG